MTTDYFTFLGVPAREWVAVLRAADARGLTPIQLIEKLERLEKTLGVVGVIRQDRVGGSSPSSEGTHDPSTVVQPT